MFKHSLSHFHKASDVGTLHIVDISVGLRAVFDALLMDIAHDGMQTCVNLIGRPGNMHGILSHFKSRCSHAACIHSLTRSIEHTGSDECVDGLGQFPQLKDNISGNLSPMATIAKYIKEKDPDCKIIFIGPCTAKKAEFQTDSVRPYVDSVITFEELQALFDSRNIDLITLEETHLDHASCFGRIFARSGGLADAVAQGLKEHGLTDFEYRPVICDGIEQCKIALLKASRKVSDANFIEGMACVGGCVGGAGVLKHGEKNRADIDAYGADAGDKTIKESVDALEKSDKF